MNPTPQQLAEMTGLSQKEKVQYLWDRGYFDFEIERILCIDLKSPCCSSVDIPRGDFYKPDS